MNEIGQQIPKFNQKSEDLRTDYKKVSLYFEEIFSDHEKTFFQVTCNLENEEEHKIREKEMKALKPISSHKCHKEPENTNERFPNSLYQMRTAYSQQREEVPCWVADKYRLV